MHWQISVGGDTLGSHAEAQIALKRIRGLVDTLCSELTQVPNAGLEVANETTDAGYQQIWPGVGERDTQTKAQPNAQPQNQPTVGGQQPPSATPVAQREHAMSGNPRAPGTNRG